MTATATLPLLPSLPRFAPDGLAVLRSLKEQGWCLPFIVLTAAGDGAAAAEAAELGALTVFEHPYDAYDVRTAVLNLARFARIRIVA